MKIFQSKNFVFLLKVKDFHIDVVELDLKVLVLAEKYFFFDRKNLKNLHVHINDGYEYIMNLDVEVKYDLILFDAMSDLYKDICVPQSFLNELFILKVKQHLEIGGVFGANTLPPYCRRHARERNVYEHVFGMLYVSSINVNRVFLALNGPKPHLNEIKKRASDLRRTYAFLDIDVKWLVEQINVNKRAYSYEIKQTHHFDKVFLGVCFDE
jgi:spermidine synthase